MGGSPTLGEQIPKGGVEGTQSWGKGRYQKSEEEGPGWVREGCKGEVELGGPQRWSWGVPRGCCPTLSSTALMSFPHLSHWSPRASA